MGNGFSFDKALSFPFKAAHAGSFPWIYSAAFGLVGTILVLVIFYMAANDFAEFFRTMEALDNSTIDEDDPAAAMEAFLGALSPLVPWAIIGGIASWIMWAIFQAASQRRYVRDETFYLAFGGDELRMMGVGFMWWLLQAVLYLVPGLLIFGSMMDVFGTIAEGGSELEVQRKILGTVGSTLGLMLLLFPIYVFFATRLAPCFALTIKDREFRFFDAWNVSRGRFWPILGAYLIIAIAGGIAISVIEQIAQIPLMAAMMPAFEDVQYSDDALRVFGCMGVVIPFSIYLFVRFFLSGLLMHYAGGPAAFAARHDPRGGVDDEQRLDVFS